MRIGDMRKRLELQKPTETTDSMGGYTTVYATQYCVWGSLWPLSAREQIQADVRTSGLTHRIRIRYNSELKSNWRIKFGDRYFAIDGQPINHNERDKMLEMLCKEVEA
jgi:SPP1 family predicted phage head-tail adaptor